MTNQTVKYTGPRVIVALDFPSADAALHLVDYLNPQSCRLKVGKELFTRAGPRLVEQLAERGYDVFLDLKFHDIPNTAARACAAAADLGVWMINVHALGGRRMMEAAREAVSAHQGRRPLLIAVTVLTSMAEEDLREVGLEGPAETHVMRLAGLAKSAGLDGVVCSAREAEELRLAFGAEFALVTPGIRLARAAGDDQRRVTTPAEAVRLGASYLVVGRPITAADDPAAALDAILTEITL
jgi:orotidine-5'-phosphate decarboxylase